MSLISIIVGMQWWPTKHPKVHMFGDTGAHRGISACSGDPFPVTPPDGDIFIVIAVINIPKNSLLGKQMICSM